MSVDAVDDLEAYEEMCGVLAAALKNTRSTSDQTRFALDEWDSFCRPTCAAGDCDGIGCGCPHHEDEEGSS